MTNLQNDLTRPIEIWVDAVDSTDILGAPEDFLVGYGAVCRAIARLLETGDAAYAPSLFTALAACEFVMAEHPSWTKKVGLPPLQPLSGDWLELLDDGSAELRLAASLSSLHPAGLASDGERIRPLRTHLEPIDYRDEAASVRWDFKATDEVVWDKEPDVDGLNAIFARRLKLWDGLPADFGRGAITARLADIDAFLRGETDEAKLSRLCFSLSLVDTWRLSDDPFEDEADETDVDPAYALLRLTYAGRPLGPEVPLNRDIHLLADRGDLDTAREFAGAHLRKHGYTIGRDDFTNELDARRVAAALLFPLSLEDRTRLAQSVDLSA
ncbi:hypothetical protein FIV42_06440 [Persicimonas caeni]|uniref:Uncharacterized protein n=1 Tax=Persicimonas caeni TaxID=2292766 RepID=A0A4Y6PPY2_PERCE|nr:hypothetical protein [Persicimonas caeni]QDG50384.1 hypothetical protein FIV42_06440 [Persicimonas caeni]QED31605.1 hypothetical protein FRD00_06435 [Persicimonas caeni]